MRRIGLVVVLGLSVVLGPQVGEAEQKGKAPLLGVIWLGTPPSPPLLPTYALVRFSENLRELGYVEGQDIEIDSRFVGDGTGLDQVIADLINLKVAVIVALSTPAAVAAKKSGTSIPVVFSIQGDPVGWGLVKSLAHPGGNLTGVFLRAGELAAKRLSLLHEVLPRTARIAVLGGSRGELDEAQTAARQLNVQLVPLPIMTADDIQLAFQAAKRTGATALSVHTMPQILINLARVADLARTNRLAAIAPFDSFAEFGGLMEYHVSGSEAIRRTAAYVAKILKGAKPADLPVEQPTKFVLVINLKTAKALGLTIPQSVLLRADQVIE